MSTDHDPLTDAELDQLATLDAARTPGLLTAVSPRSEEGGQAIAHTGGCREGSEHATSIRLLARGERDFIPTTQEQAEADARAIVAALNALPALLAEVRASRAATVDPDAPRLHIPADLLTRPAGGGVR
jgi:hypothetical protein